MPVTLSVTNLTDGDLAVQGFTNIEADATETRTLAYLDFDKIKAGLDALQASGKARYQTAGYASQVATLTSTASPYALRDESVVFCDTTTADVEVELPPAANMTGKVLYFKKLAAGNDLLITPNGTEAIDGTAATLTADSTVNSVTALVSTGTAWRSLETDVSP